MQRSPRLQPQCPRTAGPGATAPLCPLLLQPLHPWPCMATALPQHRDTRVPRWAAGCPPLAGQTAAAVLGPGCLQGPAPRSSCPVIGTENTVSAPKCCKLCMLWGTKSPLELSRLLRQLRVRESSALTMDTVPRCPAVVSSWVALVTARMACVACMGTAWEKP